MIKDFLETYNISIDTLKKVFPEDVAKLNAIIQAHSGELTDEQGAELDRLEQSIVEKYYNEDEKVLAFSNPEPYKDPYEKAIEEVQEEIPEMDILDALDADEDVLAALNELYETEPAVISNKESLVYEDFHVDTYQKLDTLLNLGKGKLIKYYEAADQLSDDNIIHNDRLTKSGEDVYKLYSNAFPLGTHPFSYVHFSDKDVFPNGSFESGVKDTTYIIIGDYSFLVGEGLYLRTPPGYNDNYNARYRTLEDKIEQYFASKMFSPCELIGLDIKSVSDKNIGDIVFEVNGTYAYVNSLLFNYVVTKFSGALSFEAAVLTKDKKVIIYVKSDGEPVAFFHTKNLKPKALGIIGVNGVSDDFVDKLKRDFPLTTKMVSYSEFLLRDKTPTKSLTIKDYREIIWGLRVLQEKSPEKEAYNQTIADLKILSELKFGMSETDAIRNLAKGGPVILDQVEEGDLLYGYSKSGKLIPVTVFDVKKGVTTWIAAKSDKGEVISGDVREFKTSPIKKTFDMGGIIDDLHNEEENYELRT